MTDLTRRTLLADGLGAAVGLGALAGLTANGDSSGTPRAADSAPLTVRPARDLSVTARGREELLAPPQLLSEWGVAPGHQVRLRRTGDEFAAFTVRTVDVRAPVRTVWLTDAGRERLGTRTAFEATVASPVPNPTLAATEAVRRGEYVERVVDRGKRGLVVGAPHGGDIEPCTDRQAAHVIDRLAGSTGWIGRGWRPGGGAYDRWHVPSTDVHPASFPALGTIADRGFEYAVSFHGSSGDGIRVGGGAPAGVKREVRAELERAVGDVLDVRAATDDEYAGTHPGNFVNWLTATGRNGVQLEQGLEARTDHWQPIAAAVASVFE